MAYEMKGIDIPTWATIKSYFTVTEQQHMLQVTNGDLDLFDCASVMKWAPQIYTEVASGKMPPGGPKWTGEMINNFFTWWKQGNCN
ncbi:hypothetical protein [Mucilaginibacter sp.]|uniref:hypothetical protein n=1 Tax=Mucilaginibacter sp. TaxID=1882438 RepID=UPI00284B6412|nr:hypothetical protein [Mucilaginibacter sp.]MDR3694463.1 hypothetical protein [Mucilaginibacter sp.]